MSKLYETLAKTRNENRESRKNKYEEDVLGQLLLIAFRNPNTPDELPKVFTIHNVILYQDQFESLMKRLGFDVTVQQTNCDYVRGITYQVTQN